MSEQMISRRSLLLGAIALPLTASCAATVTENPVHTSPTPRLQDNAAFLQLQKKFDARLGVWAMDLGSRETIKFQADQRFAFCSTHKAFSAAAVLRNHTLDELDQVVHYSSADLVTYSPITEKHVDTGMSLRALCEAAICYSDNTAANLLFANLGGPKRLEAFLRSLGDEVSDVSRTEPSLNSAKPGDIRDTTTPEAWGQDLRQVAVGDELPETKRDLLNKWLVANTTGDELIKAAAPQSWRVGDKSGAGKFGTRNDIAVLWPPNGAPIVIAILSSRSRQSDGYDNRLISQAAAVTLRQLAG